MVEPSRIHVERRVFEIQLDHNGEFPLADLTDRLAAAIAGVDEKCRGSARVRVGGDGDLGWYIDLVVMTPESDDEMSERVRRVERYEAEREERDRQEFERLRAKLNGKGPK